METIHTPVDGQKLERLLIAANYDKTETQFLAEEFKKGFSIGYQGPTIRQNSARNIPFQPGVGDKYDMWNKLMKEVGEKRIAGPFKSVPFSSFIQSPIGLVIRVF